MTQSNGNIFRVTGPLCGEFTGHRWIPTQRPVTWNFDVYFDLRLNKLLSKESRGWWFETPWTTALLSYRQMHMKFVWNIRRMNLVRSTFVFHVNFIQNSREVHMKLIRTCVKFTWTSYEFLMKLVWNIMHIFMWILHEVRFHFIWTSYKILLKI